MKTNDFLPLWENPEIQEINRLPMRSPLQPFASTEKALADAIAGPEFRNPDKNPLYLGLGSPESTNLWKFKLIPSPMMDLPPGGGSYVVGNKRENTATDDLSGWGKSPVLM